MRSFILFFFAARVATSKKYEGFFLLARNVCVKLNRLQIAPTSCRFREHWERDEISSCILSISK